MKITGKIHRFFGGKKSAGLVLAVEAGENFIKAAAVRAVGRRLVLAEKYAGEDALAKLPLKLRKWQALLEDAETVLVVPEGVLRSCRFLLPPVGTAEREQAVKWEIMQRLGWEEENFYYGWQFSADEACAAAAPRSFVGRLIEAAAASDTLCAAAAFSVCTDEELKQITAEEGFFTSGEETELPEYRACLDAALGRGLGRELLCFRTGQMQNSGWRAAAAVFCLPCAAVVISAALLCAAWTEAAAYREKQRLEAVNRQLAAEAVWQERCAEAEKLETQIRSLNGKLGALRRTQPDWTAAADGVGRMLPSECWLEHMELKAGSGMTLQGGALAENSLTALQEAVRGSGLYGRAELLETAERKTADGTKYIYFVLRLQPQQGERHEVLQHNN